MLREVYAMAAPPGGVEGSGSPLMLLWPWLMIFVIFYLLVFRPQRQKQKELEKKISELEKGDKVVTSGGLLGIVAGLKEKTVTIKVADNVKVEVLRSSISHSEKAKTEKP
jgi:preprotein translocase subunit YajC